MKRKRIFQMFLVVLALALCLCVPAFAAGGDVAGAVEQTWTDASSQIKTVVDNVVSWLTGGTQFVNQADTGGVYNGQWIMATSRWVTKVYKPAEPLPRTGY